MQAEYQKRPRMGYQPSNDVLRITIPKKISFPSCQAWIWVQDQHTVVLSPNAPEKRLGALLRNLTERPTTPGSREITLPDVKHIGIHFGTMSVKWETEGDRILLYIPPEDERKLPRQYGGKKPAPEFKLDEAETERVKITGFDSEWRFNLTIEQVLELTAYANRLAHPDS